MADAHDDDDDIDDFDEILVEILGVSSIVTPTLDLDDNFDAIDYNMDSPRPPPLPPSPLPPFLLLWGAHHRSRSFNYHLILIIIVPF